MVMRLAAKNRMERSAVALRDEKRRTTAWTMDTMRPNGWLNELEAVRMHGIGRTTSANDVEVGVRQLRWTSAVSPCGEVDRKLPNERAGSTDVEVRQEMDDGCTQVAHWGGRAAGRRAALSSQLALTAISEQQTTALRALEREQSALNDGRRSLQALVREQPALNDSLRERWSASDGLGRTIVSVSVGARAVDSERRTVAEGRGRAAGRYIK